MAKIPVFSTYRNKLVSYQPGSDSSIIRATRTFYISEAVSVPWHFDGDTDKKYNTRAILIFFLLFVCVKPKITILYQESAL